MNFPSSLPSSETDVIGESDSRDTLRVVSCTSKLVDGFSSGVGIGRVGRDQGCEKILLKMKRFF